MNLLEQTVSGYKNIIARLNAQIAELAARARQLERDSRLTGLDESTHVASIYAEIARLEAQQRRAAHELNEILIKKMEAKP